MLPAAPSLPLVKDKSLKAQRPQGFRARDAFQAALQQRLVGHAYLSETAASGRQTRASLTSFPDQASRTILEAAQPRVVPCHPGHCRSLPLKANQRTDFQKSHRTREEDGTGHNQESSETRMAAQGGSELPPAVVQLIAFLEEQPGGTLKLPPEGQGELGVRLLNAGFSPAQVEQLLSSPRIQEQGLTAGDLLGLWQRGAALKNPVGVSGPTSLKEPAASQANEAKPDLTASREYLQRWERLRLPGSALPEIKLELQRLGVEPQALAHLDKQCGPQGLPLTEVWKILKGLTSEAQTSFPFAAKETASLPLAGDEVAGWRTLLEAAGLEPCLTQALLGGENPATSQELTERLLKLEPQLPTAEAQETPKPLYLPENLRLRTVAWQEDNLMADNQGVGQEMREFSWSPNSGQSQGHSGPSSQAYLYHNPALTVSPGSTSATAQWSHLGYLTGSDGTTKLMSYLSAEVRQTLWSQIQSGIISHLKDGVSQVILSLDPPELGQVHLTLQLSDQQVTITAVTSRPEVAELAHAEVQQLVKALGQQGLVLAGFQVRPQEEIPPATSKNGWAKKEDNLRNRGTPRYEATKGKIDRFV